MAVQRELWLNTIEGHLYKGFEAIKAVATDDSAFVNATKVHIPNAGAMPKVRRNVNSFPYATTERADTTVEYSLLPFRIGPVRLGWSDLLQLSYDKFQDVVKDQMGGLDEAIKDWAISQWWTHNAGAADRLVSTTATAVELNWLNSGGGNLKVMTGADVRKAGAILNKEKFPATDRYLIADYVMFRQLLDDVSYNAARIEIVGGLSATIDNIYGFKVFQLPYVAAVSANSGTVTTIAPNDDSTITHDTNARPVALAFHKSAVGFAWTTPKVFDNTNDADYFGDKLSAEVYGGGKYRRADGKGVVAIRATS